MRTSRPVPGLMSSVRGVVRALAVVAPAVFVLTPVEAQVVVNGRVEDALSRAPIWGARVVSPDSTAVYTDSVGVFAIELGRDQALYLEVAQFGYAMQRFDLPEVAPTRTSVLLLEPIPVILDAINVVAESALSELFESLRRRRNGSRGSSTAFDRAQLERFAPVGSVWDLVQRRASGIHECDPFSGSPERWLGINSGICYSGRNRTPFEPNPEVPILVCVDGWASWSAISELESIDIRTVALVELFGRGYSGIRVYTSRFLASAASSGRSRGITTPLAFGC